jgi:hypothetical protein
VKGVPGEPDAGLTVMLRIVGDFDMRTFQLLRSP